MIGIKSSNDLRTSAEIKSYRSLRHGVGSPMGRLDRGRIGMGLAKRLGRQDWKIWLRAGSRCAAQKKIMGS